GRRITSTTLKTKPVKPGTGLNLQNPRDLIIYYFRKAVATMSKRGFPRLDPETHREFSEKCSPRPEAPPVKNISVLYEKAMFSGLGLVLATFLLRRRGRKWEKIKPLMTEQRPMRLRQFISLLWLVALVAILFAPSVRFGLGGGSTPLAASFHAIQPYLAHLESKYKVAIINDTDSLQSALNQPGRKAYFLLGPDQNHNLTAREAQLISSQYQTGTLSLLLVEGNRTNN